MTYSFGDFLDDVSGGMKDVISVPKSIFSGIFDSGGGSSITSMFSGAVMSMILPLLIPLVLVLLIFKLL
jgi:hypothetical protein